MQSGWPHGQRSQPSAFASASEISCSRSTRTAVTSSVRRDSLRGMWIGERQPLKLYKTGATEAGLRFINVGTIVRCVLPNKYQRYLIRYGILPNGGMPAAWRARLNDIVHAQKAPVL